MSPTNEVKQNVNQNVNQKGRLISFYCFCNIFYNSGKTMSLSSTPDKAVKVNKNVGRFFEAQFPKEGDIVMGCIKEIQVTAVRVTLPEYGDIEGMIIPHELTRKRIRSIRQLVRKGQMHALCVLNVDPTRGTVDLSKQRVSAEESEKAMERYAKSKKVHSIMCRVAELSGLPIESVCRAVSWPLHEKTQCHAYDVLQTFAHDGKANAENQEALLQVIQCDQIDSETQNEAKHDREAAKLKLIAHLRQELARRIKSLSSYKLRADIEVTCYGPMGIDAIIMALNAGQTILRAHDPESRIVVDTSPHYVLWLNTTNFDLGQACMTAALESIKLTIESHQGGAMVIREVPRVVVGQAPTLGQDQPEIDQERDYESSDYSDDDSSSDSE